MCTASIKINLSVLIKGTSFLGGVVVQHLILVVFYTALSFVMSLILTIFALVFITELISWIGKSVLLDMVRVSTSAQSTN
jgi:hypothetical protein